MTTNRPPSCDLPKEFYSSKLKPCPFCDSERIGKGDTSICLCSNCGLWGPDKDPRGQKWNSIPRRSEVLELLRLVDIIQNKPIGQYADYSKTWGELKQYAENLRKKIGE